MRKYLSVFAAMGIAALAPGSWATDGATQADVATRAKAWKVMARAKLAQGGSHWDALRSIYTTGELQTTALHGPFRSLDDLQTGRHHDRYNLGYAKGDNGFDGVRAWSVDASGKAHETLDAEARAVVMNEAWRRSYSFWNARRPGSLAYVARRTESKCRFDVVRATPEGGRPFEIWVDVATGLFDRFVEASHGETLTTFLSDYRDVRGVKLPFALRVANGAAKYDQLYIIQDIAINVPIDASDFAMPSPE